MFMMDISSKENLKEKESYSFPTKIHIQDPLRKDNLTDMVNIIGRMEIVIKEITSRVKNMDMEC